MLRRLPFWLALACILAPVTAGQVPAPDASGVGLGRVLAAALAGGLALAVTPSSLVLLLAQCLALGRLAAAGNAGAVMAARRAAATAAGALAGFVGLAVAGLAASSRGEPLTEPLTWGAQFGEPVLLVLLALAMLVVCFNLWGLLRLPLRPSDPEHPAAAAGGGLLAGLALAGLSLAWNVPWLGEAVGPALAGGALPALAAAAVVTLGTTLPYLLLAFVPPLLRRLPWPARRLARVPRLGELLGWVLLGCLLWVLYLLSARITAEGLALIEMLLLALGLLVWARSLARRPAAVWAFTLAALLTAALAVRVADDSRQEGPGRAAALGERRPLS